METKLKIGSYSFAAEPFHCDFKHRLFLGHLCNALLNAADYHSSERGYGMSYLNTMHKTWVLSRLAIKVKRLPKAKEQFVVNTWIDDVMRMFTSRNFTVDVNEDEIVSCKTVWAMIDTTTRRPVNIAEVNNGLIVNYIDKEKPCSASIPDRISLGIDASMQRQLQMEYSDADVNGHVNSVKLIDHVLDLFDISWHRQHAIDEFDIFYKTESHPGDVLSFYKEQTADNEWNVRVERPTDKGFVEVCRCRIVARRE